LTFIFRFLRALAEDVGKHVLDIDVHSLDALIGDDLECRKRLLTSSISTMRSSSLPSRNC
jgi:hypothetical protein